MGGACGYGEEPSGSKNAGNFLTAEPVSFSGRTLLHGVSKCVSRLSSGYSWYLCWIKVPEA